MTSFSIYFNCLNNLLDINSSCLSFILKDHSYEEGEKPIKIEPPSKPIEVEPIEIIQPPVEVPAEPATIEVAEEPVKKEKEPELGWLSVPISLKILKQKLYKIFTIK